MFNIYHTIAKMRSLNHPIVTCPIIFIIVTLLHTIEGTQDDPLVNTTAGIVRGIRTDDGTTMFLGIPFAYVDPSNPFGAANSNVTFDGVFDANDDSVNCPQPWANSTLDCLRLNIHVPNTTRTGPMPVFVYIHGGGFFFGNGGRHNFGSKFLIRHDVIFVSFNYRLGVYGFMCLRTEQVPGNQGLKDQQLALRWIKNNIRHFGGDDESITIAGDSAGGVSVDSQVLYAEAGLFHRAIVISGTALGHWAFQEPDLDAAFRIASHLGFDTNDTNAAVAFLSNRPSAQVISATSALQMGFGPCVEIELPNSERFVTSHPVNTAPTKAGTVPIIAGYTDDESLINFLGTPAQAFETLDIFNQSVNLGFDFGVDHDAMQLFVRQFYAADEQMSVQLRREVIDFDSDFRFNHPTQRSLTKYLDYGGVAYHYVFSYIGDRNMQRVRFNITEGGATHADDLTYFLDMPDITDEPTEQDQLMIDRVTTMWTNFAKYGNPTPSTSDLLPVQWLPVSRDRLHYLNLTLDLELSTRPFHQRLSFWDYFYYTNMEYIRGYSNNTSSWF